MTDQDERMVQSLDWMKGPFKLDLWAVLLIPLHFLLTTVGRFFWIPSLVLGYILHTRGFGIAVTAGFVVVGTLLTFIIVRPILFSLAAMIALALSPVVWPSGVRRENTLQFRLLYGLKCLVFAVPVGLYLVSYLLGFTILVKLNLKLGWPVELAFAIVWGVFLKGVINLSQRPGAKPPALLLRRYSDAASAGVSRALQPVLTAFFTTATLDDPSLENARPDPPEGVPIGTIMRVEVAEEWQTAVTSLLNEADYAVIDVSDPTTALGWEIVESASREPPLADIILVGYVKSLMLSHDDLYRTLCTVASKHVPNERANEIVALLRPPLPYSDDLANGIFALRFFRRLRL